MKEGVKFYQCSDFIKLLQTRQLWVRPWAVLNRWLCRHHKRKKKNGPGATPGIFIFIVFVLIIRINYSIQWFFSAEAILFQVYVIVVGNAPYGKRHVSRTKPVYGKLNILDQEVGIDGLNLNMLAMTMSGTSLFGYIVIIYRYCTRTSILYSSTRYTL